MPVIIDEVTADIAPPTKAAPAQAPAAASASTDSQALHRELLIAAERGQRTRAN